MAISDFGPREHPDTLVLFDVDGTLTPARREITPEMEKTLKALRKKAVIGFVGGSDFPKQEEQLGKTVKEDFDYCFSENGLTAFRLGKPIETETFITWFGEERYNELVKFSLRYLADLDIPKRRGTFIEFRKGLVNISPVGRNASQAERDEYEKFDLEHNVRKNFVAALKEKFPNDKLTYSIGGQISFDVFPTGWDKTYCLQHVEKEGFKTIHFFGDKSFEGGNDYEIYSDPRTEGHAVKTPADTIRILNELFDLKE